MHACLRGYADHPQDERLHHTITRTDERFDLWRFIIIISGCPQLPEIQNTRTLSYLALLVAKPLLQTYLHIVYSTVRTYSLPYFYVYLRTFVLPSVYK